MGALARKWNAALKAGGFFGATTSNAERACEGATEGSARNAAKLIGLAKEAIAKGDADMATRWAFMAGMEWEGECIARVYGGDITRGLDVLTAARNGAVETNARHGPERDRRMARMSKLVPKLGVDSAVAECEVLGLGGRHAIKRQWYRHAKKV